MICIQSKNHRMYLKKDEQLMTEEVIIVSVLVTFEFVLFYKKKWMWGNEPGVFCL